MPIIKAAIKALRQSEKRRKVNRAINQRMKTVLKEIKKLAGSKNFDEFKKKLPSVVSVIDKAAKHHIIHRNNAARKKSLLAHYLAPLPEAK